MVMYVVLKGYEAQMRPCVITPFSLNLQRNEETAQHVKLISLKNNVTEIIIYP